MNVARLLVRERSGVWGASLRARLASDVWKTHVARDADEFVRLTGEFGRALIVWEWLSATCDELIALLRSDAALIRSAYPMIVVGGPSATAWRSALLEMGVIAFVPRLTSISSVVALAERYAGLPGNRRPDADDPLTLAASLIEAAFG